MFAGGIADKLGNRYEAKCLVRQLIRVIRGEAHWIRFEGIEPSYQGFEFAVGTNSSTVWHQTKVNGPHGNWTISALRREKVLEAFSRRLKSEPHDRCAFTSQDPARDLRDLTERANIALSIAEFRSAIGQDHSERFDELKAIWGVDDQTCFQWLQRLDIRTLPEAEITETLDAFFELCFTDATNGFAILRDFMEKRINRIVSTESSRAEIRTNTSLELKDWQLDTTLRERLTIETNAYLETYIPFGSGGSSIPRPEADELYELITDPDGPSVLLLSGIAGCGKSGVVRELIARLRQGGIDHLALRIDHQHQTSLTPN
jgi:hypothetical protein